MDAAGIQSSYNVGEMCIAESMGHGLMEES